MLMPFLQPLVAETVRESFLHTETSLFDKDSSATTLKHGIATQQQPLNMNCHGVKGPFIAEPS